jgi:flagellar export protein FliJ
MRYSGKFKLRRVLALRRRLEKQALLKLSVEIGEKELRQQAVEESEKLLDEVHHSADRNLAKGVRADQWNMIVSYLDYQTRTYRLRYQRLLEMAGRRKLAREALTGRMQDRKVIETLEDNWKREMRLAETRKEQRVLDEIGLRNRQPENTDL